MSTPSLVLFDLDGTLVDTAPDLAHAVNLTLAELGLPQRGEHSIRAWIGNGVQSLLHRALTGTLDGRAEPGLQQRALEIFLDRYLEFVCCYSQPYPGALELLDRLDAAGIPFGMVTNKREIFTRKLLSELRIEGRFRVIVAGDSVARLKPDPLPLRHAAGSCQVPVERVWMVGDSSNDIAAARAAGMRAIGVTYGYNHGQDIRDFSPDAVIDSLLELAALL